MKLSANARLGSSDPFSPLSVPGFTAWFSPRTGVTNVSGAASSWASGSFAATQATGSKRPSLATGINAQPTLDFVAASSQDIVGSTDILASGTTRYVLAVMKSADAVGGGVLTFRQNVTGGRVWSLLVRDIGGTMFWFTDGVSNSATDAVGVPTLTSPIIVEWELTAGATPVVRLNNVARTMGGQVVHATGELGTTGFRIGSGGAGGTPWNGSISDIYVTSGIPSLPHRAALRNYFASQNLIRI